MAQACSTKLESRATKKSYSSRRAEKEIGVDNKNYSKARY